MIPELEELINTIKSLPGIGPKAATRMALYLIENKNSAENLSKSVNHASQTLGRCAQCGNISRTQSLCSICSDSKRDRSQIAIVSNITDIFAIEKAGVYNGLYFVFSNINDLFQNKSFFDREISNLQKFIQTLFDEGTPVKEVIFALPYNIDSEVACSVITDTITNPELSTSRIALGMPSGADFDYTDKLTIIKSFKGRTKL